MAQSITALVAKLAGPSSKKPAKAQPKRVGKKPARSSKTSSAKPAASAVERVIEIGYGDNVSGAPDDRIMHFRVAVPGKTKASGWASMVSDRRMVQRCLAIIGPYNGFVPATVYKALQAHFAGLPVIVSVGRESSPVMYLEPFEKIGDFRSRCAAFAAAAKASEAAWENGEFRCWWD